MTQAEIFALNEWLTEYPDDMTYDEVCEMLLDEDERVVVWQWFECMPPSVMIENIDNTKCHFENVVNNMKARGELA
jgi:hypothetical protein